MNRQRRSKKRLAVEGHPDFFIHVTVGASLNYKTGEPVNICTSPVQA